MSAICIINVCTPTVCTLKVSRHVQRKLTTEGRPRCLAPRQYLFGRSFQFNCVDDGPFAGLETAMNGEDSGRSSTARLTLILDKYSATSRCRLRAGSALLRIKLPAGYLRP